jgi:20S proteasome subunit beta 2
MSSGFDFSLYPRNCSLDQDTVKYETRKTGTTIAAVTFNGGVVLGADSRATMGSLVDVKEERKISYISDNILCLGAGTSADTDQVTRLCASKLRLFEMSTGLQPRVEQAATFLVNHLYEHGGYIEASLLLGGVDFKGPAIYGILPDGSVSRVPFGADGSGMLAAISVLEGGWRVTLSEEEAKELVANAIQAGITNDLGSGSNVDLGVITKDGITMFKKFRVTNERPFRITIPITNIEVEIIKTSSKVVAGQDVHLEILDGPQTG